MNKTIDLKDILPRTRPYPGVKPMARRTFLKVTALAGAGFAIGCAVEEDGAAPATEDAPVTESAVGPFVRVTSDNKVTVIVKNFEMGQGVSTGLPTLIAEELDADWSQVSWEHAPSINALYGNPATVPVLGVAAMGTGGSDTMFSSYEWMRKAGATARAMLVGAAAAEWAVPVDEIEIEKGVLSHPSGRSGTFGAFAEAASLIEPPTEVKLKDPSEFKLIGKKLPRLDSDSKTTGQAEFTIDVNLPGMLHASIVHPPKFGGQAVSINDSVARAMPGVADIVTTPKGVAVVADSFYHAKSAADALEIDWDLSATETRGTEELFTEFRAMSETPGLVARDDGDIAAGFDGAAQIVEATYEFPYLNHAQIEPLNAVVRLGEGECEVWTGAQSPTLIQMVLAQVLSLPLDNITVHSQVAGGSFGRRATIDYDFVLDAALIAKAMNTDAPVKLQWTRETDMRAGYYRPMGVIKMRGALDADGNVMGWEQRNVVPPIFSDTPLASIYVHNGVDHSVVEGADINPYEIANLRLEVAYPKVKAPISWWRSVGHSLNGYAMEVFMDELAAAGGRDSVALRQGLLQEHPRHKAVLDKAVAEAGPAPSGAGKGRGVAMHESFRSYVAQVVDVTLNDDGTYKVDNVVCAIDCGVPVNPDVITAQMEGSISMGLGAIMREEITLTDGQVDQSNYFDYFPMRMRDMPEIDVHIIPSTEQPTGVGEPGLPPVGPALANALRNAGAQPIRRLPIGDQVSI